ncbi:NAD-dependent epimerase/dehydratase family protein, partial [Elusimicrobiota bacterium]
MFNTIIDKDNRNDTDDFLLFQGRTGYTLPRKGLRSETLWHYQGTRVHDSLWFTQPGWAKVTSGTRLFGKYFGATTHGSQLYGYAPGLPLDIYTTRLALFSGFLIKRFEEQLGKGKKFVDGKEIVLDQKEVNKIMDSVLLSFPGEDEIHSVTPEDYHALYAWVKDGMHKGRHMPINKKAAKVFRPLLEQMQKSSKPAIRNLAGAIIETPFGEHIIIDDRPKTPSLELYRNFSKWIPVNDLPSIWLRRVGRSLAQGMRGEFYNDMAEYSVFSDTGLMLIQVAGLLLSTVFFNMVEVSLVGMAWTLCIVILGSLLHSKFTAPLFDRIRYRHTLFGQRIHNPISLLLLRMISIPYEIVHRLFMIFHDIAELLTSNALHIPQVMLKPLVLAGHYIFTVPDLIRRGVNAGAGGTMPMDDETVPIWRYYWIYRAPYTAGLALAIIFFGGSAMPLATLTLAVIGLVLGLKIGIPFWRSDDYKARIKKIEATKKKFEKERARFTGDYASPDLYNAEQNARMAVRDLWRARLKIWAPIVILTLSGLVASTVGPLLTGGWFMLFSLMALAFVAVPYVAHLAGTQFGKFHRYIPVVNWFLGFIPSAVTLFVHLPKILPYTGDYLEFVKKSLMPVSTGFLSGDGAGTAFSIFFNMPGPFGVIHTFIFVGVATLFVGAFFWAYGHAAVYAARRIRKKTKPGEPEPDTGVIPPPPAPELEKLFTPDVKKDLHEATRTELKDHDGGIVKRIDDAMNRMKLIGPAARKEILDMRHDIKSPKPGEISDIDEFAGKTEDAAKITEMLEWQMPRKDKGIENNHRLNFIKMLLKYGNMGIAPPAGSDTYILHILKELLENVGDQFEDHEKETLKYLTGILEPEMVDQEQEARIGQIEEFHKTIVSRDDLDKTVVALNVLSVIAADDLNGLNGIVESLLVILEDGTGNVNLRSEAMLTLLLILTNGKAAVFLKKENFMKNYISRLNKMRSSTEEELNGLGDWEFQALIKSINMAEAEGYWRKELRSRDLLNQSDFNVFRSIPRNAFLVKGNNLQKVVMRILNGSISWYDADYDPYGENNEILKEFLIKSFNLMRAIVAEETLPVWKDKIDDPAIIESVEEFMDLLMSGGPIKYDRQVSKPGTYEKIEKRLYKNIDQFEGIVSRLLHIEEPAPEEKPVPEVPDVKRRSFWKVFVGYQVAIVAAVIGYLAVSKDFVPDITSRISHLLDAAPNIIDSIINGNLWYIPYVVGAGILVMLGIMARRFFWKKPVVPTLEKDRFVDDADMKFRFAQDGNGYRHPDEETPYIMDDPYINNMLGITEAFNDLRAGRKEALPEDVMYNDEPRYSLVIRIPLDELLKNPYFSAWYNKIRETKAYRDGILVDLNQDTLHFTVAGWLNRHFKETEKGNFSLDEWAEFVKSALKEKEIKPFLIGIRGFWWAKFIKGRLFGKIVPEKSAEIDVLNDISMAITRELENPLKDLNHRMGLFGFIGAEEIKGEYAMEIQRILDEIDSEITGNEDELFPFNVTQLELHKHTNDFLIPTRNSDVRVFDLEEMSREAATVDEQAVQDRIVNELINMGVYDIRDHAEIIRIAREKDLASEELIKRLGFISRIIEYIQENLPEGQLSDDNKILLMGILLKHDNLGLMIPETGEINMEDILQSALEGYAGETEEENVRSRIIAGLNDMGITGDDTQDVVLNTAREKGLSDPELLEKLDHAARVLEYIEEQVALQGKSLDEQKKTVYVSMLIKHGNMGIPLPAGASSNLEYMLKRVLAEPEYRLLKKEKTVLAAIINMLELPDIKTVRRQSQGILGRAIKDIAKPKTKLGRLFQEMGMSEVKVGFVVARMGGVDGVALEAEKWIEVEKQGGMDIYAYIGEGEVKAEGVKTRLDKDASFSEIVNEAVLSLSFKQYSSMLKIRDALEFALSYADFSPLEEEGVKKAVNRLNKSGNLTKPLDHDGNKKMLANLRELMGMVTERLIEKNSDKLADSIDAWIDEEGVRIVIPENVFAIPMQIPLGVAMAKVARRRAQRPGDMTIFINHNHDFYFERERYQKANWLNNTIGVYLQSSFPLIGDNVVQVFINSIAKQQLLDHLEKHIYWLLWTKDELLSKRDDLYETEPKKEQEKEYEEKIDKINRQINKKFDDLAFFRRNINKISRMNNIIPNVMDFNLKRPELDKHNKDFRKRIGVREDDFLMGTVVRIVVRKSVEISIVLLFLMKRISKTLGIDPDKFRLILTGGDESIEKDDYVESVKKFAGRFGLKVGKGGDVIIVDQVDGIKIGTEQILKDKDGDKVYSLDDIYANLDFKSYSSTYEGFGNALLEAMWAQLITIIYRYSVYDADIRGKLKSSVFEYPKLDGQFLHWYGIDTDRLQDWQLQMILELPDLSDSDKQEARDRIEYYRKKISEHWVEELPWKGKEGTSTMENLIKYTKEYRKEFEGKAEEVLKLLVRFADMPWKKRRKEYSEHSWVKKNLRIGKRSYSLQTLDRLLVEILKKTSLQIYAFGKDFKYDNLRFRSDQGRKAYIDKMLKKIEDFLMYFPYRTVKYDKSHPILITGGNGFLGHNLLMKLLKDTAYAERNFVVLDKESLDESQIPLNLRKLFSEKVTQEIGDITDPKYIESLFNRYKGFPQVIHLAAQANMLLANKEPVSTFKINVQGTLNISVFANLYGSSIINASTGALYGDNVYRVAENGFYADDKGGLWPGVKMYIERNNYTASKYIAEKIPEVLESKIVNLRISSVYGYDPIRKKFKGVPGDIIDSINAGQPPSVTKDIIDYIHIDDVTAAIIASMNRVDRLPRNSIFNVGTGAGRSGVDLAKIISKTMGTEFRFELEKGQGYLNRLGTFRASNNLGWTAQTRLIGKGIEKTLKAAETDMVKEKLFAEHVIKVIEERSGKRLNARQKDVFIKMIIRHGNLGITLGMGSDVDIKRFIRMALKENKDKLSEDEAKVLTGISDMFEDTPVEELAENIIEAGRQAVDNAVVKPVKAVSDAARNILEGEKEGPAADLKDSMEKAKQEYELDQEEISVLDDIIGMLAGPIDESEIGSEPVVGELEEGEVPEEKEFVFDEEEEVLDVTEAEPGRELLISSEDMLDLWGHLLDRLGHAQIHMLRVLQRELGEVDELAGQDVIHQEYQSVLEVYLVFREKRKEIDWDKYNSEFLASIDRLTDSFLGKLKNISGKYKSHSKDTYSAISGIESILTIIMLFRGKMKAEDLSVADTGMLNIRIVVDDIISQGILHSFWKSSGIRNLVHENMHELPEAETSSLFAPAITMLAMNAIDSLKRTPEDSRYLRIKTEYDEKNNSIVVELSDTGTAERTSEQRYIYEQIERIIEESGHEMIMDERPGSTTVTVLIPVAIPRFTFGPIDEAEIGSEPVVGELEEGDVPEEPRFVFKKDESIEPVEAREKEEGVSVEETQQIVDEAAKFMEVTEEISEKEEAAGKAEKESEKALEELALTAIRAEESKLKAEQKRTAAAESEEEMEREGVSIEEQQQIVDEITEFMEATESEGAEEDILMMQLALRQAMMAQDSGRGVLSARVGAVVSIEHAGLPIRTGEGFNIPDNQFHAEHFAIIDFLNKSIDVSRLPDERQNYLKNLLIRAREFSENFNNTYRQDSDFGWDLIKEVDVALGTPLKGAILYLTMAPCFNCADIIGELGIKRVVYDAEYPKRSQEDTLEYFEGLGIEAVPAVMGGRSRQLARGYFALNRAHQSSIGKFLRLGQGIDSMQEIFRSNTSKRMIGQRENIRNSLLALFDNPDIKAELSKEEGFQGIYDLIKNSRILISNSERAPPKIDTDRSTFLTFRLPETLLDELARITVRPTIVGALLKDI